MSIHPVLPMIISSHIANHMNNIYAVMCGLLRELSPGPIAPEARIMPLDQAADVCVGYDVVQTCVNGFGGSQTMGPLVEGHSAYSDN